MSRSSSAASDRLSAADLLGIAVWFGLITGFVELGQLAWQKWGTGEFLFLSQDVLWLAPTLNVITFGLGALVLLGVGRMWRPARSLRVAAGFCLFLATTCALLLYHSLSGYAVLILSLGIAVQLSKVIARHGPGFSRLVGRSVVGLGVMVILSGAGLHLRRWVVERRAVAALPAPPGGGAPNILLIVLDTVRSMSLSLYGYGRETTPNLTRWASRGVRFDQAIATAPWTLPSHASIFTGRWPHQLSADYGAPLDATYPVLAGELSARGYRTGGFVANKKYTGWETGLQRGFCHYEDFRLAFGEILRGSSLTRAIVSNERLRGLLHWYQLPDRKDASEINRRFLEWLDRPGDRPFFAFLNYFDAHGPYLPPAPFANRFGSERARRNIGLWPQREPWDSAQVSAERDAYESAIAYLDSRVGELLDSLDRRGTLANTIVVIVSDHGEAFAEHGTMAHGHDLYRPTVHVPLLLIYPPRVPAGFIVRAPVSTREIPATLMGLLGQVGQGGPFPGPSLARWWTPGAGRPTTADDTLLSELRYAWNLPDRYAVSHGDMNAIVAGGYRYIVRGDGRGELYGFSDDELEQRDLAADSTMGARVAGLRGALKDRLANAVQGPSKIRSR